MIDYDEHIDDEQTVMNEGGSSIKKNHKQAIHLDDHISTLGLRKPITIQGETSIATCLQLMQDEKIGCLLITESEKLIGIFTERDIIRRIVGKGLSHEDIDVQDYMTKDPDTLTDDAPLAFALNYMVLGGYRHVPIIDTENRPLACLSIKDIVKHIGNYYFSEIANLPPTPKNPGWFTMDGG
ncbi:MAG: CBS domain-containing protein [Candidatus Marinimicrobia bacterium]|nr:CBS domain-containing protein [Candidatus Neomarinimicrobiota bacterium]